MKKELLVEGLLEFLEFLREHALKRKHNSKCKQFSDSDKECNCGYLQIKSLRIAYKERKGKGDDINRLLL